MNVAGEGSKFGFQHDKLREEMELLMALPRVSIEGLMCIPPLAEEAEGSRKHFVELRELRDALEKEFQVKLPQLSMGMTNDYSVAVEEGATLVRVGTAIFGERRRKSWRDGLRVVPNFRDGTEPVPPDATVSLKSDIVLRSYVHGFGTDKYSANR